MKQYISLVSALALLLLVQAGSGAPGDLIWQQTLGGPGGEEWGYSLDATPDGGLLVTGIAYSTDANVTGARGNGDLWVVRLDPSGNLLWDHAFGGNESDYGLSVRATEDGGSVIIGTTGSMTGDVTGYHGNGDLWVIRLSSSGESVWKKVYGGNLTDEGGDIIQTADGGFLAAGYTMSDGGDATGHRGGGDLWLIRLGSDGSVLWQKTYGGSGRESGSSLIATADGGYAITGNTYSTDGDVTASHGSSDVWVVKTDSAGNLLWQKTYGGSRLDWGHSLVELPGGDLVVAGVTASADGDVSLNHGAGDIWLIRLTPGGDLVWEKTYGGSFSDNVWKIHPAPTGGVYLSGETFSVDGDFAGNHGDADLLISEIDGNGTLLWYKTYGGQNYESGSWVRPLPDGTLTACGTTRSMDGDVRNGKGEGDLWVVKVEGGAGMVQPPAPAADVSVDPAVTPVNSSPGTLPAESVSPVSTTLLPAPGMDTPPSDPDGDGLFEDLNGNGKADMQDPSIFFTEYDWIVLHYPVEILDFNTNGAIDLGDVNELFLEVSG